MKMVAYKDEPDTFEEKEYRQQSYRPAYIIKDRHGISNSGELPDGRFSSTNDSIDRLVQMPANDRFHQQASEKHSQHEYGKTGIENSYHNYPTQPVWFEKIMREIEKDKKKENPQPAQKQLYFFMN
jgi:hypothetical protein